MLFFHYPSALFHSGPTLLFLKIPSLPVVGKIDGNKQAEIEILAPKLLAHSVIVHRPMLPTLMLS
jgi:hypothetical protein